MLWLPQFCLNILRHLFLTRLLLLNLLYFSMFSSLWFLLNFIVYVVIFFIRYGRLNWRAFRTVELNLFQKLDLVSNFVKFLFLLRCWNLNFLSLCCCHSLFLKLYQRDDLFETCLFLRYQIICFDFGFFHFCFHD